MGEMKFLRAGGGRASRRVASSTRTSTSVSSLAEAETADVVVPLEQCAPKLAAAGRVQFLPAQICPHLGHG
jgi:hypothetical protein